MRFIGRNVLTYLPLFLVVALVITGCGGGGDDEQDSKSVSSTTSERTHSTTVVGGEIKLDSGGSIQVPEGVQVEISSTQTPELPDDVEAIGEALAITSSDELTQPAILRFPIPTGIDDPETLVIIRVEADGSTTFLMTEVEGDELVAATPGFSTFTVGQLLEGKMISLNGPGELLPEQRATYRIDFRDKWVATQGAKWTIVEGATLVYEGDNTAIVQAGKEEAYSALRYEVVDLTRGMRWFGYKPITITSEPTGGLSQGFTVSVMSKTTRVYSGDDVYINAAVYGDMKLPITWTWDLGNGKTGGPATTDENVTKFELPVTRYLLKDEYPKTFRVSVTAKDNQGREVMGALRIGVVNEPLTVRIDGPQRLTWDDPSVSAEYTISTLDPFSLKLRLLPGGEQRVILTDDEPDKDYEITEKFTFNQPGEHRLEVEVEDFHYKTAKATLPIIVEGGEALHTHMLDLPATAKPNEKVSFSIQIRGGLLIASGKKAGYTLTIDWGDGSKPYAEENVGLDRTPYQGTVVPVSHTYAEAKTYPVTVEVFDAAGSSDSDMRDIEITEVTSEVSGEGFVLAETILSPLPQQPITWRDQFGSHSGTITLSERGIIWDVRTAGAGGTDAGVSIFQVDFGGLPSEVSYDQKIETTATWGMTISGDKPRYTTGTIELYGGDRFRTLKRADAEQQPSGTAIMEWYLTQNSASEFIIKAKVLTYDRYVTIEWVYRRSGT